MDIKREMIEGNGFEVPCITLTPAIIKGAAVVIHGYGGCKEEQLGLAYRIAKVGLKTCVIDFRGHGEHNLSLDENCILDVEAAIKFCRAFGKVIAIGHSLGGRLALISSADYSIGISPAISPIFAEETQNKLKIMRSYRVKEAYFGKINGAIEKLPVFNFKDDPQKSIIYAERDIPEIEHICTSFKAKNSSVIKIKGAMHNDIFTLEATFQSVISQLKIYFRD